VKAPGYHRKNQRNQESLMPGINSLRNLNSEREKETNQIKIIWERDLKQLQEPTKRDDIMTESTRAMTGPRTLTEMIPPLQATYDLPNLAWTPTAQGSYHSGTIADSWQVVGSTPSAVAYETNMDLSGYELDDLTIYPLFIGLQDPGVYSVSYGTSSRMRIIDIVSQERLDLLATVDEAMQFNAMPGMSATNIDFIQILSGQFRMAVGNTILADQSLMQTVQSSDFGSASPTSARKLWLYRFVIPSGTFTPTSVLQVPASRFVIRANIAKESDLSYLMRQKRSYELAAKVD